MGLSGWLTLLGAARFNLIDKIGERFRRQCPYETPAFYVHGFTVIHSYRIVGFTD